MLTKIPRSLFVVVFGLLMFLPQLGSFGLWEPAEMRHADMARDLSASGNYRDLTVAGKHTPRPALYSWLLAAGFKVIGVGELAGRLPIALCAILTLLLLYRTGRKLFDPTVGMAAAFIAGTTAVFIFQARQMTSDMVFFATSVAAIGGMLSYLWPADGQRSRLDLALAFLGLALGPLARGFVVGGLYPVLTIFVTLSFTGAIRQRPTRDSDGQDVFAANGEGALEADTTLAAAVRQAWRPLALVTLAGLAVGFAAISSLKPFSFALLGGQLQPSNFPPTFDEALRDLGFTAFPWIAILPIALGYFLWPSEADRGRDAVGKQLATVALILGYLWTSLQPAFLGKTRFIALPWIAFAVAVFLVETWRRRQRSLAWGVIALAIVLMIAQDYFAEPESLAFSHLLTHAAYPKALNIKVYVQVVFGVVLGGLMFFSLAWPWGAEAPSKPPRTARRAGTLRALLDGASDAVSMASYWVRLGLRAGSRVFGPQGGRNLWIASGLMTLGFAGWCAFWLTPELSLHLSNKQLYKTFQRCHQGDERLVQYLVPGGSASYYANGPVEQLPSQSALFERLRRPARQFVLVPATQLAPLHQALRRANVSYYVLDDSSSQYLILSNKLAGRCDKDLNPLSSIVLRTAPRPQKPLYANFEDRVELIGYDLPDRVSAGGKFKITLYFRVKSTVPAGFKLFVHFDKPAHRFHGDHEPLQGRFATQYWLPGDYIVDTHEVPIPRLTTPTGVYQVLTGFWQGERRLKVTAGPHDGENRVRLGKLVVSW
ncbi:MAG: glycosyltransferase family 39 protein [Deltaproteobacteria bacterium]|nr:glycosyltransferase family 39 protein [Deltaproteobacteria bacterium]